LQIALGDERRQIVAGIAEKYSPEDIVGKTVVVVANLEPAKLMGIESQGMLLAVNDEKGVVSLVTSERDSEDGLEVR
jgi:methionine--tRNA ligase beta chain